jgi:hypothetical protein
MLHTIMLYYTVNSLLPLIQASGILSQPGKISKKFYHFHKVTQKQICTVHIFTYHTASSQLPLTELPITFVMQGPLQYMLAGSVSELQYIYLKSSTHKSVLSHRKTHVQELMCKHVTFTIYCVSVCIFIM